MRKQHDRDNKQEKRQADKNRLPGDDLLVEQGVKQYDAVRQDDHD
jgi:hypothetical protein